MQKVGKSRRERAWSDRRSSFMGPVPDASVPLDRMLKTSLETKLSGKWSQPMASYQTGGYISGSGITTTYVTSAGALVRLDETFIKSPSNLLSIVGAALCIQFELNELGQRSEFMSYLNAIPSNANMEQIYAHLIEKAYKIKYGNTD
jgi:hypothetical protein